MINTIMTGFAVYFVIWWLVLFLTLPFGVRSQHEDGAGTDGTDPGAPVRSLMGWKLLATTVVSGVLFLAGNYAHGAGYFNIERLSRLMGIPL